MLTFALILLTGMLAGMFLGWAFLVFADVVFIPAACVIIYVHPAIGLSAVLLGVVLFQVGYVLGGVGIEFVRPKKRRVAQNHSKSL